MLRCSIDAAWLAAGAALALGLWAAACVGGGARQCAVGADCASGVCRADGTCAPDSPDGGSGEPDAGPGGPDGGVALCQPNHDGIITRAEVPVAAGRSATFRVATDAEVDTAGQPREGGGRRWDLGGNLAGDHDLLVTLRDLDGAWYAEHFPGADYAARLSTTQDLLGVFEATDGALLLRGVVSPEGGGGRTQLIYDPPAKVLGFPMARAATWQTTSTVSGLAQGVGVYYTEAYESEVDQVGELGTPYGDFPVQRVRVRLTRQVGLATITVRSFLFVAECYGTVATVVSTDNEPAVEFTAAAEARRLAP